MNFWFKRGHKLWPYVDISSWILFHHRSYGIKPKEKVIHECPSIVPNCSPVNKAFTKESQCENFNARAFCILREKKGILFRSLLVLNISHSRDLFQTVSLVFYILALRSQLASELKLRSYKIPGNFLGLLRDFFFFEQVHTACRRWKIWNIG